MKIFAAALLTLLGIAVIAEGAYLVKTRRELAVLERRLQATPLEREPAAAWAPSAAEEAPRLDGDDGPGRGAPSPHRVPPPRFVGGAAPPAASDDPLPLPAALDSPESREQLRQFVAAQMERQREEERLRREEEREQAVTQARERVARELGLNADESRRMQEMVAAAGSSMRELREKARSGQMPGADIGREFRAARERYDQQLRSLLGDARMEKLQELQRSNPEIAQVTMAGGRGGRGGPGGPGGWRGGAPGGGGPPGGGPGGPPAGVPPAP
jgi:hypothetical protein